MGEDRKFVDLVTNGGCFDNHCVALADDGSLWAWGGNQYKQTHPNTSNSYDSSFQQIKGTVAEHKFVTIATSDEGTAGITTEGKIIYWGSPHEKLDQTQTLNLPSPVYPTQINFFKDQKLMVLGSDQTLYRFDIKENSRETISLPENQKIASIHANMVDAFFVQTTTKNWYALGPHPQTQLGIPRLEVRDNTFVEINVPAGDYDIKNTFHTTWFIEKETHEIWVFGETDDTWVFEDLREHTNFALTYGVEESTPIPYIPPENLQLIDCAHHDYQLLYNPEENTFHYNDKAFSISGEIWKIIPRYDGFLFWLKTGELYGLGTFEEGAAGPGFPKRTELYTPTLLNINLPIH